MVIMTAMVLCFFFQAEDGIRDGRVTGVQTCALPICDAGLDLFAAAGVRLEPGQRAVVPTGIAIALPDGYAAFIHPRSGLAARHGVTLVNAPGTVDAGYRG